MTTPAKPIRDRDVQGLKYFKKLRPLLGRLRDVGTERDRAGSRRLTMDQYGLLVLLWLFNPLVNSLRGLQQTSALQKVQKKLGIRRASLGSLSESVTLFDPEPLKQIAKLLSAELPATKPGRFAAVGQELTAVDGSVVDTVVRVARLAWLPKAKDKALTAYRLHTHFEVLRGIPRRIDVTPAKPKGADDERAVLERTLEPDRCYLIDCWYGKFSLWNAIVAARSSYVCRVRDNSSYRVLESRPLTPADIAAGVLSDELVEFTATSKKGRGPNHPVRLIQIAATPHQRRGKYRGGGTGSSCDGTLRIATDRLDLPAELLSEMYRLRWLIELFFKMFKQFLGCRHLLSTKHNGVEIQAYCAIIACLLILQHTGRLPTKRTFEMVCFYLSGWASLAELEAHIRKLKTTRS